MTLTKNKKRKKLVTERYSSAGRFFFRYWFSKNPFFYLIATVGICLTAYMQTWPNMLIGTAIDDLREAGLGSTFYTTVALVFLAAGVGWLFDITSAYLWTIATFRFERDIRQEFFEVIQNHSMSFHDVHDSGVLLSMGMNEVSQIRFAYNPGIRQLMRGTVSFLVTVYFIWRIESTLGMVLVGTLVVYLLLASRYAARIGPVRRRLATELGDMSSASQEIFRGIDVVRSFDNEDLETDKFNRLSGEYADSIKKEGYLSSFYWPALLLIVVTAAVFMYCVVGLVDGTFSAGEVASILVLLLALNRFNFLIPRFLLVVQAGKVNADRLWKVMTFDDPMHEPEIPKESEWEKSIVFDNVSFVYPGTKKKVLDKVSMTIPPGSRVALIGGPGSGKTTVLKLLLRLYDPIEGTIRINGIGFHELNTKDVRDVVTLVEQEAFLFSDSIRANIAFSKPNASDEEVRKAAELAQAANFIEALPEKYDEIIGERGVTLSGGQRQRLAIARALLSDPTILLLDDSTSAIDVKTEVQLRAAMEELIRGRTSIIVTQRLSTLAEADMIVLLRKGKVLDIGTHDELLTRCEEYQFMCAHLPKTNNTGAQRLSGREEPRHPDRSSSKGGNN